MPHRIGMEPIFSEWWDPIIAACAETDTVICLHVGSTGVADMPKGAPMVPLGATLFGQLSLSACAEWLWSGYAVKHPDLKIIMSEGGIGWVAMLHDRLENIVDRSGYGHYFPGDLRPAEILHRNFWFSTIDDPSTLSTRDDRRGRPHHVRVRLPARRRHLARHPGGVRRGVRRAHRRRDREDLARERGRAVPPSAATGEQSPRRRRPPLTPPAEAFRRLRAGLEPNAVGARESRGICPI